MEINLQAFLLVSLVMTVVIALLFVVNAIFAKKISAKIRYLMWIVIMIGLIMPIRPAIGDGVIDVPEFTTIPIEINALPTPENNSAGITETPTAPLEVSDQNVETNEQLSLQTIAFSIWATVAIGIIGYHIFQYIRFQRSIWRWSTLEDDENSLAIFEYVKQEIGLQNCKVKLVICGFVSTSMLTGFLKPIILLPERNYDDAELELILRHELIHYRRKDLWIKLLAVISVAIHWFNPLVYLMSSALQTECEASCDQEVLKISQLENRHSYVEVIIGMIGDKKSGMTTFATNFYNRKKGIKKRLRGIMAGTTPNKSISYVFLTVIVLLTATTGSVFAIYDDPLYIVQDKAMVSYENNGYIFEIAISAVGGGVITDYKPSDELLVVHIEYNDEVYHVNICAVNNRIIGIKPDVELEMEGPQIEENQMPVMISAMEAKEIAVELIGDGVVRELSLDTTPEEMIYNVIVENDGVEFEVILAALDGAVIHLEALTEIPSTRTDLFENLTAEEEVELARAHLASISDYNNNDTEDIIANLEPTQAHTSSPTQASTSSPTQAPSSASTQASTSAPTQAHTSAPTQASTNNHHHNNHNSHNNRNNRNSQCNHNSHSKNNNNH